MMCKKLKNTFMYIGFVSLLLILCILTYPEVSAREIPNSEALIEKAESYSDNQNVQYNISISKGRGFISEKYIIGPNDVITIHLPMVPELSQEKIRVLPNGQINITPLGTVKVAGLSMEELRNLLIERYKYYLVDPQITVNLEDPRPFIVYVTGAVLNPGNYELTTSPSHPKFITNDKPEISIDRNTPLLTNVLVAAGGVLFDADLENVVISNANADSKLKVNLIELLETGDSTLDVFLSAGDSVHIPRLPSPLAVDQEKYKKFASATFAQRSIPIKVIGYVNRPGLVRLEPQTLTLNGAITAAGGYLLDSAYAPKKVYVSRADNNGKLVTTVVNPMNEDLALLPNDMVYVPDKARPLGGKFFDYLTRIVTPTSMFAGGYNSWALMFNPTRYTNIVGVSN